MNSREKLIFSIMIATIVASVFYIFMEINSFKNKYTQYHQTEAELQISNENQLSADATEYPDTSTDVTEDLKSYIIQMIMERERNGSYTIGQISDSQLEDAVMEALNEVRNVPGFYKMSPYCQYLLYGDKLDIEITYDEETSKIWQGMEAADAILERLIVPGMTDYEKILAIHDYLVNNTIYPTEFSYEDSSLFSLYGPLVEGYSVCDGYADAFKYMANTAGVETIIVTGTDAESGIEHAWNMVKLSDGWYHVDVTWDDPVTNDGAQILSHYYFNVTNQEIERSHTIDSDDFPYANQVTFNYYTVNNMVVYSKEAMIERMEQAIDNRMDSIELKLGFDLNEFMVSEMLSSFEYGHFSSMKYNFNDDMNILTLSEIKY